MRATRQTYTDEFRSDAVSLYLHGERGVRQVAADLGVKHWTLREWVRKYEDMKGPRKKRHAAEAAPPVEETLEEKVKRLERQLAQRDKQIAQLEMDRAILKKAAAFFAKESE
jgi:transposase